jgi:ribosomal protein S18 acetylase RimI-like enzyme
MCHGGWSVPRSVAGLDSRPVWCSAPLALPVDREIWFRYAVETDGAAIVALIESAYRGETSRAGWTTEADLLGGQRTDAEEIAELIRDPSSRVLLATQGDDILGCVLLRQEPAGAYLGMLAVRPGLQAKGMGKQILAEAEARARREFGSQHARMTVIEQRKELIAWYERRGYADTGRREPFPYGNPRFGLPKRDDLRFVVLAKAL